MPQHRSFTLSIDRVSLTRGDRRVLDDVSLTITADQRIALTGPNGVGKSTLLAIMAGDLEPDTGRVTRQPATLRIGTVRQELPRHHQRSAHDHLAASTGVEQARARFEQATTALSESTDGAAADRYDRALSAWLDVGAADFDHRVAEAAETAGLDHETLQLPTAALSGGQAARVGLMALLLSDYDITLLDEPTNDLDQAGLHLLDQWVADHPGALVVVSHDRAFMERTVSSVAEIDEHHHTVEMYHGGWEAFTAEREARLANARRRYDDYIDERDRLRTSVQRQREWADRGASRARKNPADGDKFRRAFQLDQTEQLAGRAGATSRALDRLDVVEKPWEGWNLRFTVEQAPRSAHRVVVCEDLVMARGEFSLGPLDLEITWGERVHLAGPNGSGKTTLIDTVLGRHQPSSGSARLGSGVIVGELTQRRNGVVPGGESAGGQGDAAQTILDAMTRATSLPVNEARSVLAKFGLDADAVARSMSTLSPGERTRAALARFQAQGVNLVVLDEPTNHLDIEAIQQLEQALGTYDGTLIVVSHDQRFVEELELDRTITIA